MRDEYRIELAAENHLRQIPAIELASAAMFSEDDLPAELRFLVTDNETLRKAQGEQRLWIALDDANTVVGFALACIVDDCAHLDEMDVHPDHGRRGIGTRLLSAVIAWARSSGYPAVTLITFRHLPWNAPFYQTRGFEALAFSDAGDGLRALIREEAEAGLEPRNRLAMRCPLERL